MTRIAVEKGLNPIKEYLVNEGYDVREFDDRKKTAKHFLGKFEAVVLKGESINVMGMQDTMTETSIINAKGMSPEDVKNQIESKINN